MKKCVLLFLSLFAVAPALGQEAGNRIYGNTGYYAQKRHLQINTGNLGNSNEGYSIEASVLTNLKPDAFVLVFGVNDDGSNAAASNEKVNTKIGNLIQRMKSLGIDSNDVFIDFITQNRVYDFKVSGTQATENFTGFETKKTIAIRYKNRELFEKIVSAAADCKIFDLIKVDYIVSDFEAVRAGLFDAGKKSKLGVYTRWEKDSGESEARVLNQPNDKEITELEYYDLSADPDEMTNTSNSSAAQRALSMLFGGSTHGLLYSELQAELPEKYKEAQARAYHALLTYERLVNASTEESDAELAKRIEDESELRVKAAWTL